MANQIVPSDAALPVRDRLNPPNQGSSAVHENSAKQPETPQRAPTGPQAERVLLRRDPFGDWA